MAALCTGQPICTVALSNGVQRAFFLSSRKFAATPCPATYFIAEFQYIRYIDILPGTTVGAKIAELDFLEIRPGCKLQAFN